ncbi:MAG: shikimate kinase, partial [Clostridia bacterium]|nr:shikimate kinase [Clostridia bacterium]
IVLIGMPACGKTTVGHALATLLGRRFVDVDEEIVKKHGDIPEIFAKEGEAIFRLYESEVIAEICKEHRLVIATGGGAVLKERNRLNLRQNGMIVWIRRALDALTDEGRPLSQGGRIEALYRERELIYKLLAELAVDNDKNIESVVGEIAREVKKL